jgi:hypothetical protein
LYVAEPGARCFQWTGSAVREEQVVFSVLVHPKPPDMWENVKVEQVIFSGLKPLYDGCPEKTATCPEPYSYTKH